MYEIPICELERIADTFLRDTYGMRLEIPIKRNNRLRRSQGRYIETYDGNPERIEIAGYMFDYGADSVIIDTLKHELIHYALSVLGKPNGDGHPYFEAELRKYNAPSTGTPRVGLMYLYKCTKCGKVAETSRKRVVETPQKFKTRCCHSPLEIIGQKIYDGTEAV